MIFKEFLAESLLLEKTFEYEKYKYTARNGSYTKRMVGNNKNIKTEKIDKNEYDRILQLHQQKQENDLQGVQNDLINKVKELDSVNFSSQLLSKEDVDKKKPGIYVTEKRIGKETKKQFIIYTNISSHLSRTDYLSQLLGKEVKDTDVNMGNYIVSMKPVARGKNTQVFASDYISVNSMNKIIEQKNLETEDFIKQDCFSFSKDNNDVFKEIILDSIKSNKKFSKQEIDYVTKIMNMNPKDLLNEKSNDLFISFGEIIIPYLLLCRNERNKKYIDKIVDILPDQDILSVEFPNSQNNQLYDYQIISDDLTPSKVTDSDEKVKLYKKTAISAKYGEGHKVSITTEVKNNYQKYFDSLTEDEKEQFYKCGYDKCFITKLSNTLNENSKNSLPDYISLIDSVTDGIPDKEKFINACTMYKGKNQEYVKYLEKYKKDFFDLVSKSIDMSKYDVDKLKEQYPSNITFLCCQIINENLLKEENQKLLKILIGNTPYYQIRILKNKNIQCEVINVNKDSEFNVAFKMASGQTDFALQKGNLGCVIQK